MFKVGSWIMYKHMKVIVQWGLEGSKHAWLTFYALLEKRFLWPQFVTNTFKFQTIWSAMDHWYHVEWQKYGYDPYYKTPLGNCGNYKVSSPSLSSSVRPLKVSIYKFWLWWNTKFNLAYGLIVTGLYFWKWSIAIERRNIQKKLDLDVNMNNYR